MDIATSICLSLLIILIDNPFSIMNVGLQLSYGGTIGIIYFYKRIYSILQRSSKEGIVLHKNNIWQKLQNSVKEMLSVTLSAQLVIFPIIIMNFHTISFTFFISNLLVGYILGTITIGGFVLIFISVISLKLSDLFCIPIKILLNMLILIAEFGAKLPLSKIYVTTPNLIFFVIYYIGIIFSNYIKNIRLKSNKRYLERKMIKIIIKIKDRILKYKKKICLGIIVLIIIILLIGKIPKDLKIHFIDVGQGDSCLIITPTNKKILIDAGGNERSDSFDVGESTIVPYLLDKGIKTLDYIMVSHFDSDHCRTDFLQW